MKIVSILEDSMNIFKRNFDLFNQYYWHIDTQGGYLSGIKGPDDYNNQESLFIDYFIEVGNAASPNYILDVGRFSHIVDLISLDEWTTFIGFQCSRYEIDQATRMLIGCRESKVKLNEFLLNYKAIYAVFPDGWWEVMCLDDKILNQITSGYTCTTELLPGE
jgi:hypothetical protein